MRFIQPDAVFAYLYGEGTQYRAYYTMGAHCTKHKDEEGVYFAVWAPSAQKVSVVGDFNGWDPEATPMARLEQTGVWDAFVPGVESGFLYKYAVTGADGVLRYKADPYGFASELRPKSASIVTPAEDFPWTDASWMKRRETRPIDPKNDPINIYEVHPTSWLEACTDEAGIDFGKVGKKLAQYARRMHYTHVELMPVMEYPLDMSWGYQLTGFYAVTARLGEPDNLKRFVDACHKEGVGVILDWVPGHFCKDGHGLIDFDGTHLYGHIQHPHWGTERFDFSQRHVWSFLISNALYWLDNFHVDGFRVDGLASMLSLNFGRGDQYFRNANGGDEDLDAIDFLTTLNSLLPEEYPGILLTAEDSSTYPHVTYPVSEGGLGFHLKWSLGWMHDTLNYMEFDPLFRSGQHNKMTFAMMYALEENYILSFSHDEVVHGKKSLIGRMPGDYAAKFANLRVLAAWQILHPGKKLTFMGNEIAQFIEWRYDEPIEWFLLDYPMHEKYQQYIRALNAFYLEQRPLYEQDNAWEGFSWIDANNASQSVFSFTRTDRNGNTLVAVFNCTPVEYPSFAIGVDAPGRYVEVFNTDLKKFGGNGVRNARQPQAQEVPMHGRPYSISFKLPGLTALVFTLKNVPEAASAAPVQ